MTLIILVVPARRVEYFDEDTTKAQQFIVMREDEKYPSSVLSKTLLFPVTNESVPFDDVEVERIALVHAAERDRMVYL